MSFDFKKEEDVKEYLENLGIEYRFECFHEKKPDGCHRLGDFLEAIKKDFKKAGKVFQSTCDDMKYGKSCFKFGNYSFLGRGCKQDRETAFNYYKLGCEYENPESCLHAGLMLTSRDTRKLTEPEKKLDIPIHVEGPMVPESESPKDNRKFKEGVGYFDRGCTFDNPTSCFFASSIYMMGAPEVTKDFPKAFQYSVKACDLGNVYACANLSRMYKLGDGTEKNDKLAELYKAKATDLKNQHLKQFRKVEFERVA